nr:NirD/YgiW/YdeI family stress tolerance protein [uncultured Marinobacter sp.]
MKRTALSIAVSSALVAAPAMVQAAAEAPYLERDGSWINLSGTVTSTTADTFMLDYGDGLITVEMDDWDWFEESGEVLPGDKVTVYGEVDDDTFEGTKIEASSVFVENLGTYFFASAADEETFRDLDIAPTVPVVVGDLVVTGTVTSVTGQEFTIDSGAQQIKIDTALMPYNPTDDEGYQQVAEGDLVTVTGNMEEDTFEKRELMAESVVTLDDESGA